MTKYGDTGEMQKLAWGGAKSTVPDRVTSVQNLVTSLINNVINRTADYDDVPESISQIANIVASDILRPGGSKLTTIQILDEIKMLADNYIDQAPAGDVNWGNVRWV